MGKTLLWQNINSNFAGGKAFGSIESYQCRQNIGQ
jgi:hypothetical protein